MGVYRKNFYLFIFLMMTIWRLLLQSCPHSILLVKHTINGLLEALKLRSTIEVNTENERLLLYVQVVVETLNLEISRCHLADYAKEMYLKGGQARGAISVAGTCCSDKTCIVHTEATCSRDQFTTCAHTRKCCGYV